MKKVLKVLGIFVIAIIIIGAVFWIQVSNNMKAILEIDLNEYQFSELEDGLYNGSYYYEEQIGATVSLTIENGEIKEIVITDHLYGLGQDAENIVDDIIIEQTLDVDAIAGATTSSKIIQLAIQDAIENGVIE